MKGSLRVVLEDNIIKSSFSAALLLIALQSILVIVFYSNLPPYIPFLNSEIWGEGRLVVKQFILLLVTALLIVFSINNGLVLNLYSKHPLLSRLLSFNTLLFVFLAFLAFIQILLLVF